MSDRGDDGPEPPATSEDHDPWAFMDDLQHRDPEQTAPYQAAPPPPAPPPSPPPPPAPPAPTPPPARSVPREPVAPEPAPWRSAPPPEGPPASPGPSAADPRREQPGAWAEDRTAIGSGAPAMSYWSTAPRASFGPQPHPSAGTAMVLSLVGLLGGLFCLGLPLVLSPVAWRMGSRAVREIDADPGRYSGREQAVAAKVCGIIGTVLLLLVLVAVVVLVVVVFAAFESSVSDPSPGSVRL